MSWGQVGGPGVPELTGTVPFPSKLNGRSCLECDACQEGRGSIQDPKGPSGKHHVSDRDEMRFGRKRSGLPFAELNLWCGWGFTPRAGAEEAEGSGGQES